LTGTSRWGNADTVLADKLNLPCLGFDRLTFPMQIGSALEPHIIHAIKDEWGPGEYLSQVFLSRKHLGFTPDLIRLAPSGPWRLAEIKVSVKVWNDTVPSEILDQVGFQATVLGINHVECEFQKWMLIDTGVTALFSEGDAKNSSPGRVGAPGNFRSRCKKSADSPPNFLAQSLC
jgi:hypothetical protein